MPPAVDCRNVKRIGEPLERGRAGGRDRAAPCDQAAAIAALRRGSQGEGAGGGVGGRILLESSECGLGIKSGSGIGGTENAAGGIAEIGNRVERDVRYGLAEHDVEDEEIIDRRAWIADRAREDIRGLHGKTRTEEAIVERDVPDRDGARNGVLDHLADVKVFEKVAVAGLRHISTRSFFGRTDRAVFGEPLFIWLGCGVLQEPRMRASAARERETTGPRGFAIGRSVTSQRQLNLTSRAT